MTVFIQRITAEAVDIRRKGIFQLQQFHHIGTGVTIAAVTDNDTVLMLPLGKL